MFALLANGPGPPYPTSDAPWTEWLIWGGCLSLAAVLGVWALYNLAHSKRTILAVITLLIAPALFVSVTLFVMVRGMVRADQQYRQMEQLGRERNPDIEQQSSP